MNLKIILAFISMGFSSYCLSEICILSGADLARYAHTRGLSFTFSATENTHCQLSSHKAGGSAASSTEGGVCTFDLFLGKNLLNGWNFNDISYAGRDFDIVNQPAKSEDNLHVRLLLKPKENGTAYFLISSVTIEGNSCAHWKSAL